MAKIKYTAEQIIGKLREVEVILAQGGTAPQEFGPIPGDSATCGCCHGGNFPHGQGNQPDPSRHSENAE